MQQAYSVTATGAVIAAPATLFSAILTGAGDAATAVLYDAAGLFLSAQAGSGFANQPTGDSVTIVSNNAADVGNIVTIYGTTNGTETVVKETMLTNGVTGVVSTKTDWGEILGVEKDTPTAGTITVSETSGGLAITTMTALQASKGVVYFHGSAQYVSTCYPHMYAGGASTKKVGLVGTDIYGAAINQSKALNGTAAVLATTQMKSISKVLVGDLASASAVTILAGTILIPLMKAATNTTAEPVYFPKSNCRAKRGVYAILTGTSPTLQIIVR